MSQDQLSGGLQFSSRRSQGQSLPGNPSGTEDQAIFSATMPDTGAHLDEIRAPEICDDGPAVDDVQPIDKETGELLDAPPPDQIDQAAFFTVFGLAFQIPQMIDPIFKPVAIQPGEKDQARAASDALYSLLEIYYPQALMPGSETIGNLVVVGSFVGGKVMVVRACIQARKLAALEAANRARESDGQGVNANVAQNPPGIADNWHMPEGAA